MSTIGNYLRLPEDDLNRILKDPDSIRSLLCAEDYLVSSSGPYLNTGKSWHLIHYLLNGEAWEGREPLFNAVLGGTEIGSKSLGYGPVRYLLASEVQEVAAALAPITPDWLWSRFELRAVRNADIYPSGWEGSDREREYIFHHFQALKDFFAKAAIEGDAVILFLD